MSTPTEVTALARRWACDLNMGTDEVPDWQRIMGITELSPSAEPNIEDSSDYEGDGWTCSTKTGQAWELALTINRKINDQALTYHPTHEALRLAAYSEGSASRVHIRRYDRNGLPEAYEGYAVVTWAESGGEHTALDQVEVTLTGDGKLELIDNPLAP